MSKETVVQPANEIASAPLAAQPVVEKNELPELEKPAATAAALKKVAPKPKATEKPDAKNTPKTEAADKPAKVKKAPAAPVVKSDADAKTTGVDQPKAEKISKVKKHSPKKPKLMRDSFTLPEGDYALFAILKQRALDSGVEIKKSELLRASLALLAKLDDAEFITAIGLVERIKTGRPKK